MYLIRRKGFFNARATQTSCQLASLAPTNRSNNGNASASARGHSFSLRTISYVGKSPSPRQVVKNMKREKRNPPRVISALLSRICHFLPLLLIYLNHKTGSLIAFLGHPDGTFVRRLITPLGNINKTNISGKCNCVSRHGTSKKVRRVESC